MKKINNINLLPLLILDTLSGILVGTILSILQGVGVINIGWFWATFPFWIVPAVWELFIIIVLTIVGISSLKDRTENKD